MYTANLTANLTLTRIKNDIHGLKDLPGKAVGSWENYAADLRKYNLAVVPFPWNNADDEEKMIEALKEGYIKALVMPDQTLSLRDAVDCDTMIVGNQFAFTDESHVFPYATWFNSPSLILEYDQAIQRLLLDGAMEELQNRFIKIPQATCKTSGVNEGSVSKVEWQEVTGLWIMLAGALVLGIIAVSLYWGYKLGKPWLYRQLWYRKMCCMGANDHEHWGAALTKSYTRLVSIGRDKSAIFIASPSKKDKNSDEEIWAHRYDGAVSGYLDGSADVQEREARAQPAPQQQASMLRTDTANRRGNGNSLPAGETARRIAFETYVLNQIAELRNKQDLDAERAVAVRIPSRYLEGTEEPNPQ